MLADPVIGALNLVQWPRVQGYQDAHHDDRVGVRIDDLDLTRKALTSAPAASG